MLNIPALPSHSTSTLVCNFMVDVNIKPVMMEDKPVRSVLQDRNNTAGVTTLKALRM